ncbi:hypothetical protein BURPS406E_K0315 [Burkholderia pseudomallei 406e]|uniref:Uncharacterized protein n=1 Tax=Burkholderia pseudomallei 1710a TaxID=320371 RepID=A0A0E1W521_BURPE|nr:hypothetical protein BURPS668_3262 [Burkholderia pseudomallei 668]ACQ98654.1 conserved hypothetical protein [Burkholderia pseudomallei MSHR346]AFR17189.1 hypothetical protein BPC006_I3344 [Burkholderia pseudomallei BPC006]EBA48563.1 hypothetical protein BURPS305_4079 [Burkholderia pseudomallei 305]EDK53904.1 hypothetical protein BMAFMH_0549 [Burkholderia mallei FMH]EDK58879.1 hypothetical protein BMAJHU_0554 [Burkholderia mallei JHU]EDO86331.1 hypothetical protein BURPS406E_K0315 [Burkhold
MAASHAFLCASHRMRRRDAWPSRSQPADRAVAAVARPM